MGRLFSRHSLVFQTSFAEIKRRAFELGSVPAGSPGSVGVREVNGRKFYYRQFYDACGRKAADYLGPVGDAEAEARARALGEQITETGAIASEARILAQQGYVRVDSRTGAIVGAIANHGLFRAGAVLVGSHAYGASINELGIRAAAFATDDIDIARGDALRIDRHLSFEQILAASTVPLKPVPGLGGRAPTTSYKVAGSDRLRVDLLAAGRGNEVTTRPVPELRAHAAALPYLGYLLEAPVESVILARDRVVPVRIPRSERLAWHKMFVSQERSNTSEKRPKDILQASVLFAALVGDAPAALDEALAALPPRARSKAMAGARAVVQQLETAAEERAAETMKEYLR